MDIREGLKKTERGRGKAADLGIAEGKEGPHTTWSTRPKARRTVWCVASVSVVWPGPFPTHDWMVWYLETWVGTDALEGLDPVLYEVHDRFPLHRRVTAAQPQGTQGRAQRL